MSGELGIIVELAKENVSRGDSEVNAINNARKQFDFALNEALNYEYKGVKQSKADRLREEYETEMIEKYKGIVYHVCKRYKNDMFYDEAIQEGYYHLLLAIRKYDSSRGVKINTYIYNYIWQYTYKAMCKFKGAKRTLDRVGVTASGNPSYNEKYEFRNFYSLDAPIDGSVKRNSNYDEELTLGGMLENYEIGFEMVEDKDMIDRIMIATEEASKDNKYFNFDMTQILKMRIEGMTMVDIAKELNTYPMMIKRLLVKLQGDIGKELRKVC
ncbi:MAG: sigma factor [Peptostreptococcaceae bacterium]